MNHLDSSAALGDFAISAFTPLLSTERDKRRVRGDTESRGEELEAVDCKEWGKHRACRVVYAIHRKLEAHATETPTAVRCN